MTTGNNVKYCCREHGKLHAIELKYANGMENEDYVVCRWCGMRVGRIYGKHMLKHHPNRSTRDYAEEFPNAPLCSARDRRETSKSSGLHMRLPEYRDAARNAILGDKNPNHSSRVDESCRKSVSPYSKEFYRKRYPDLSEDDLELMRLEKMNSAIAKRVLPSQPLYWISHGYTEDEAKMKVRERQRTFTMEKLVAKYGEEDGMRRWHARQIKWQEKMKLTRKATAFRVNSGTSTLASNFFSRLKISYPTAITNKDELVLIGKDNKQYYYDFCIENKIIEFNGTYWHCDPKKYRPDYIHPQIKKTAMEIWEYDKYKYSIAENMGYSVLCITEADYVTDPDGTFKKCIDFLNA
jgi:hypothetical protein